ncbi:MAG: MarR family winged helix-turn-helix transcriptional regulator [Pseudomonadota bacterium]
MDGSITQPQLRLSDFLPYRLSVLSNTVSKRIAERYQSEFGLSVWQWRVMAVLGEAPGLTAKDISERTAMDKVAVSRAVSGLVEDGILRREAAQDDGRRSMLYLSEAGQAIYARIVPLAMSYETELTQALTAVDIETLKHLLDSCADVVSPDQKLW